MTLETWLKIHTNVCNFVTASPKPIEGTGHYLSGGEAGENRGWATIVYAWLKGGAILPAKMSKASSGCHQQIQPIKTALYNNFY